MNLFLITTHTKIPFLKSFDKIFELIRGKKILEQLSRTRFFPGFEISRSFFRAKQVGIKSAKFQNPEKIVV